MCPVHRTPYFTLLSHTVYLKLILIIYIRLCISDATIVRIFVYSFKSPMIMMRCVMRLNAGINCCILEYFPTTRDTINSQQHARVGLAYTRSRWCNSANSKFRPRRFEVCEESTFDTALFWSILKEFVADTNAHSTGDAVGSSTRVSSRARKNIAAR